ncbi:hypothetical protein BDZ97DRAFT_1922251 [Flammula alnicola]|nr:hypothetical protein BDZ97DRAFT_1922251 [Flammula alnicola]
MPIDNMPTNDIVARSDVIVDQESLKEGNQTTTISATMTSVETSIVNGIGRDAGFHVTTTHVASVTVAIPATLAKSEEEDDDDDSDEGDSEEDSESSESEEEIPQWKGGLPRAQLKSGVSGNKSKDPKATRKDSKSADADSSKTKVSKSKESKPKESGSKVEKPAVGSSKS